MQDAFSLLSPGQTSGIPERVSLLWRGSHPRKRKLTQEIQRLALTSALRKASPPGQSCGCHRPTLLQPGQGGSRGRGPPRLVERKTMLLCPTAAGSHPWSFPWRGVDRTPPGQLLTALGLTTALRSTRPLLELEGIPGEEEGGDRALCDLSLALKSALLIFLSFHALRSIHVQLLRDLRDFCLFSLPLLCSLSRLLSFPLTT